MAKKTKNNKLKKQIKDAFILTLIICAIAGILYTIISLVSSPTQTFILKENTISKEESKVGYVIRDEQVLQSTNDDEKIEPIKNEGERVGTGNPVFKYYNVNEEEISNQINELNNQIQEALLGQTDLFPSDVKALESQIEKQVETLRNENNMQAIIEYKNNISDYIVKKAKIAGSLSAAGEYINNLILQRNSLEETLNNDAQYVNSNMSGVVSYRIDGLEEKLSINNLDNITIDYLKSLNLTTGQIVSKSENKAKVINNFQCYIAIIFNSEEAKNTKEGAKLTIRLSGQEEVKAEVYKIKEEGSDRLIIFKITDGVEKLINYRKISVDVIWWKYSGLIVPKSAILYENGKSYVLIKKNADFTKILVKVEKENDNYCLIDNYSTEELIELRYTTEEINSFRGIKLYDEIMVDPQLE
ncbi:MAG: HlyD family efflux transporter periplasmic adaptor subunit [Clostridia bacterium]